MFLSYDRNVHRFVLNARKLCGPSFTMKYETFCVLESL